MNKIEKLHEKTIKSNSNEEDFDAVTSGYILYDDNFEKVANQSAEITKDIAIKFRKWFNDNNYEFIDNTIVGDLYANREGSDSALTETEIFNIFIETL
jgi:hypothetical protein